MSAAAIPSDVPVPAGDVPVPASTPREIGAALDGEEAAAFDREFRRAMADATEAHDLTSVLEMLARWRHVAWSARSDPTAHQRMNAAVDRLLAGEDLATVRWPATKARLGL
jgi:hypothetical protein